MSSIAIRGLRVHLQIEVVLIEAVLIEAVLIEAVLIEAVLIEAVLIEAVLIEAVLIEAVQPMRRVVLRRNEIGVPLPIVHPEHPKGFHPAREIVDPIRKPISAEYSTTQGLEVPMMSGEPSKTDPEPNAVICGQGCKTAALLPPLIVPTSMLP